MKRKSIDMLPSEVEKVAQKITVHAKVKLVGSNSYRGLLFPSDIDLMDNVHKEQAFVKFIQKVFKSKDFKNKVWLFMDFKAGIDHELIHHADETRTAYLKRVKPIVTPEQFAKAKDGHDISGMHWTVDEILAGKRGNRMLVDSLDGIVKLDTCVVVNELLYDMTEVYEIGNKSKQQIDNELMADVDSYANSNAMKSMKRMFAYIQHKGGHKKLQKKLVAFFNSPVGGMNKLDMFYLS
jgi:hypothetical protein